MALSEEQQIKDLVARAKNILVITKRDPSGDSVGSMLALYLILKKLDKKVTVVAHGTPNLLYNFLPSFQQITAELSRTRDFIISLNISNAQVGKFGYRIEGDQLKIYIQPKQGSFEAKDVSSAPAKPKYDLVMALNCPDFAYMGKLYEENADFFYETPVINIDHRASNENYGNINLIDLTATATAEILYRLAATWGDNLITSDIATCLLTGIIADTNSFQNERTTPQSFQAASELIAAGADQQTIIQRLYRTKKLATLKLWGRLLARLQYDSDHRLVWTLADIPDFEKSGAQLSDLEGITEELIASSPDAERISVLARFAPKKIHGIIFTTGGQSATKLASRFNGSGNEHLASFNLERDDLLEAEKEVLETLRETRPGK